jgi:hypothetical protein
MIDGDKDGAGMEVVEPRTDPKQQQKQKQKQKQKEKEKEKQKQKQKQNKDIDMKEEERPLQITPGTLVKNGRWKASKPEAKTPTPGKPQGIKTELHDDL